MWLLFLLHLQRTALCICPGKAVEGSVTRNSKHWERREKRDLKKCRRFISDGNAMCVWQRTHAGLIVATWFNAAALSYSSCGWLPFHICSSPWSQGMWTALVAVCPYNLIGQHQKYGELGARHYVGLIPLTLGLEFYFLRQGLTCVVVAILKLICKTRLIW